MASETLRKNKAGGGVHWEDDDDELEHYMKTVSKKAREITTLRKQFDEFGGHKAECAITREYWIRELCSDEPWHDEKCDCGWAEIEKGLA